MLAPAVTRLLRARWLASPYKEADALVFGKDNGEGGDYRDAGGRTSGPPVKAAGLVGQGRLTARNGSTSLPGQLGGLTVPKPVGSSEDAPMS